MKCAEYRQGNDFDCIVGTAPVLPGCMTHGGNYEEAHDNLIDAIQLWITVGLREGEEMQTVNDCQLAFFFPYKLDNELMINFLKEVQ